MRGTPKLKTERVGKPKKRGGAKRGAFSGLYRIATLKNVFFFLFLGKNDGRSPRRAV